MNFEKSSFISVIATRLAGKTKSPSKAICNLPNNVKPLLLNISDININVIKVSPMFKIAYTIPTFKRFFNTFTEYSPMSAFVFFIACIRPIKNTIITYPMQILETAVVVLVYINFSNPIAIPTPTIYDVFLCHDYFRYVSHAKKFIADIIDIVNILFIIVPVKLL